MFLYTSMQINPPNKSFTVEKPTCEQISNITRTIILICSGGYGWHAHPFNRGVTLLVGLTEFHGGQVETRHDGPHEISRRMVLFDGRREHRTLKFAGLRVSLVAFS